MPDFPLWLKASLCGVQLVQWLGVAVPELGFLARARPTRRPRAGRCGRGRSSSPARRSLPGIEGLKPLGNPGDIVPAILDERLIDERVPVTSIEAYAMCGRLARAGFFVGQSSGAYLAGVEQVACREGRGRLVTLFNDLGERYFSTRLWE